MVNPILWNSLGYNNMDNFVRMYENVAPADWCEAKIELFESDEAQHTIQQNGEGETLTQINMLHSKDTRWRTCLLYTSPSPRD